jgi:DNA helicase HerA-like ATPase
MNIAEVISQLGVGEALVSTLQDKGVPMPVERTFICPPRCRIGSITQEERQIVRSRSPIGGKYDTPINRESAYEILSQRASDKETVETKTQETETEKPTEKGGALHDFIWGTKRRQGMVETMAKQAARTVGSQIGRQILRGVLGGILGGLGRR